MTRLVERADIVDIATYEDTRRESRPLALAAKDLRRIHLHENLTVVFENRDTLRYQIQEIMRVEHIVREADIVHEIDTYNKLLGQPGDLGTVLLIEIVDAAARRRLLSEWVGLQQHLFVVLEGGGTVYAEFDADQVGHDPGSGERLSAVQYLRFPVGGEVPVAIGTDFGGLESLVTLSPETVTALSQDLA